MLSAAPYPVAIGTPSPASAPAVGPRHHAPRHVSPMHPATALPPHDPAHPVTAYQ